MNNLYKDIEKYNIELNKSKEVLENNIKNNNLNIKKNIIGYSSKDVKKLIDHYNDLERLNNNIIETKPTILLEHKKTLPKQEEESYDYEEYEIIKPKNKDDPVL